MSFTFEPRSLKVLFVKFFFSHVRPGNMIVIFAFIPEILTLEHAIGVSLS